jgi:predicted ATPase
MEEGLLTLKKMQTGHYRPLFLTWLAAGCSKCRQPERGLEALDEACTIMNSGGERWTEAESYRVRSELLTLVTDPQYHDAEKCAKEALSIAQAHESRSLEVRAATTLARLWINNHNSGEARALMERVCVSSKKEIPTRDLSEARALLRELAAGG